MSESLKGCDAVQHLDIGSNRSSSNYSKGEKAARVLWGLGLVIFALSPRPFHRFRALLLRAFGARVGNRVHIYPSARIQFPWLLEVGDESAIGERVQIYNLGPCRIGSRATISQGSHLCGGTHDDRDRTMPLKRCSIEIGDDVWICADAFVGPGVSVGPGSVVGARAAAVRDVDPWTVVAGNPARKIRDRILRHESPSSQRREDSR